MSLCNQSNDDDGDDVDDDGGDDSDNLCHEIIYPGDATLGRSNRCENSETEAGVWGHRRDVDASRGPRSLKGEHPAERARLSSRSESLGRSLFLIFLYYS